MGKRTNIVIDIGNTLVKTAVFHNEKLVLNQSFSLKKLRQNVTRLCNNNPPDGIIFSTVVRSSLNNLMNELRKKWKCKVLLLSRDLDLPLKNAYKTPETLGFDRLANATAAWHIFPEQSSLIIDAGTCLKFDFIDKRGRYLGGSISPGLKMRFEALNTFTSSLPLYPPGKTRKITGTTTRESIYSGVYQGMLAEIKGLVNQYRGKYTDLNVILTGGDTSLFAGELKNGIFADRFLTLKGLNVILKHNE
jgi:type III pantothenate kinase